MKFKSVVFEKDLSHWLHWYGFSPLCVSRCILRLYFAWNPYYNNNIGIDSPHCVLSYVSINFYTVKDLSQSMHWYGFSPLCVISCILRFSLVVEVFSHHLHSYSFLPVCVFWWSLRVLFLRKTCHIDCIGMVSLRCVLSDVS